MVTLPARFITLKITLGLIAALIVSLGVNVLLLWQLAGASSECDARIAAENASATERARSKSEERDGKASEVSKRADAAGERAAARSDTATQSSREDISNAYHRSPAKPAACRPAAAPRGVQHAIEEAVRRANSTDSSL